MYLSPTSLIWNYLHTYIAWSKMIYIASHPMCVPVANGESIGFRILCLLHSNIRLYSFLETVIAFSNLLYYDVLYITCDRIKWNHIHNSLSKPRVGILFISMVYCNIWYVRIKKINYTKNVCITPFLLAFIVHPYFAAVSLTVTVDRIIITLDEIIYDNYLRLKASTTYSKVSKLKH